MYFCLRCTATDAVRHKTHVCGKRSIKMLLAENRALGAGKIAGRANHIHRVVAVERFHLFQDTMHVIFIVMQYIYDSQN